jgi:hypothetical protein
MCDCDCELPKQERWRQIREEALAGQGLTAAPDTGTWLVVDGVAREVAPLPTAFVQLTGGRTFLVRDGEAVRVDVTEHLGAYEHNGHQLPEQWEVTRMEAT